MSLEVSDISKISVFFSSERGSLGAQQTHTWIYSAPRHQSGGCLQAKGGGILVSALIKLDSCQKAGWPGKPEQKKKKVWGERLNTFSSATARGFNVRLWAGRAVPRTNCRGERKTEKKIKKPTDSDFWCLVPKGAVSSQVRDPRMICYFSFFFIFRATTEGFVLCWGFPQSCPKLVPADRWQLERWHSSAPINHCHPSATIPDNRKMLPHPTNLLIIFFFLSAPNPIPLRQEQTEQTQKSLGACPWQWQQWQSQAHRECEFTPHKIHVHPQDHTQYSLTALH